MEIIISQTNKIFTKAINRYAKQKSAEFVSILFSLNGEEDELMYQIGYDHIPELNVGFMDILGVKIDMKGYSFFVPPAIKKILKKFEKEYDTKNIVVCVYLDKEDEDEVNYFVFANDEMKKQFSLESVLELDFEQING